MLAKWKALFGPSAASSARLAIVPPPVLERSAIASEADQQKLKPGDFGYRYKHSGRCRCSISFVKSQNVFAATCCAFICGACLTCGRRYSATRMAEIPIGFERAPTFDDRNFRQKDKGSGGIAAINSFIAKKSRK